MQTSNINSKTQVCTETEWGLPSSWRWLILNVCHEAVDPQVHVLQRSVHQVSCQPAFPQVTVHVWNALHLCHQRSMLNVLSEQQRCFVWPLALRHTCGRRLSVKEKITDLIKGGTRQKHSSGTRQLCNNRLEGEPSEVHDQALEHTPVDYFSFTIVQLIDTHRITVMNLLHLHPVPPSSKSQDSAVKQHVTQQPTTSCILTKLIITYFLPTLAAYTPPFWTQMVLVPFHVRV